MPNPKITLLDDLPADHDALGFTPNVEIETLADILSQSCLAI
ncbi:MAG TPA: hypothetical protein VF896_19925 [Anaerolineales bacterium]